MRAYQLYFLDGGDRDRRRMDLECEDDGQAVAVISEHLSPGAMELWEGERLVRRFGGGAEPAA